MSAGPNRRFRIWTISLLVVGVSASILFVVRVASRPSEPYVSVSFIKTTELLTNEVVGTVYQKGIIQVSNRMDFDLRYMVGQETPHRAALMGNSLTAHEQKQFLWIMTSEAETLYVAYARDLRPIELSFLNTFPWMKQHYPFQRRGISPIYAPASDIQVSSQSKEQP